MREAQERTREAAEQIERLRAGVVDELDGLPEVQRWLVRVLAAAERVLFRHRPSSDPAMRPGAPTTTGCVGCGLDWTEELHDWPCVEVLEVLDVYAPAVTS